MHFIAAYNDARNKTHAFVFDMFQYLLFRNTGSLACIVFLAELSYRSDIPVECPFKSAGVAISLIYCLDPAAKSNDRKICRAKLR